ncbi:Cytochrome [Abeliophyllum distichum]|uniref:Cytochrome n=1 Tax=Abeliophyllum distichum TaxID=126358 RepID=A0ABD1NWA8_9LAMI
MQIERIMGKQGIRGPTYKFLFGNTKEISKKKANSLCSPMDLSHDIFPRIMPHIYSWINTYGNIFLFWNGSRAELVVTQPELVKELFNNNHTYPRTVADDKYFRKLTGDSIVACEGEKWVKRRKVANQAFHSENLKNMTPAMIESVKMMLERWRNYEGREVDVYEEFRQLTAEVISRTVFGSSYEVGEQVLQMLTKLAIIVTRNAYNIRLPSISDLFKNGDEIESDKIEKEIREVILQIIKKREKVVVDEQIFGSDFLGLLWKARHDSSGGNIMSVDQIIDECKIFYGAGQGSTAALLSWTILLLAIHFDWQANARDEVLKVIVPSSERKAKKGARLGKLILPANIKVFVPILALHRDPKIWGEDAHLFKPERFTEGIVGATKNNLAAFLPFIMGPRTCVGMNFAINETKIALSMILQRYAFTLSPNYIHFPILTMNLRPEHGVQVLLHAL